MLQAEEDLLGFVAKDFSAIIEIRRSIFLCDDDVISMS